MVDSAAPPRPRARPKPPYWRRTFDLVETQMTPRVETLVRSEGFAQTVALVTAIEARLRRTAERQLRQMWHAWNLPAATDVERLSERIAALERRTRELSDSLAGTFDGKG